MGIFFHPFNAEACCLCGSPDQLTGEHKIKASILREIFGTDAMVIGGGDYEGFRPAQGPKSKNFHFPAQVCKLCNDTTTQPADLAFGRFHKQTMQLHHGGKDVCTNPSDSIYTNGTAEGLNVLRYFAKLMCCHVASSGGPRMIRVAEFAIGKTDLNPICFTVGSDATYEQWHELSGDHQYAAHGGLAVFCDKISGHPTTFHSTLTAGPLQYMFEVRMNGFERVSLIAFHHEFAAKCRRAYLEAVANPVSENLRRKLSIRPQ